MSNKEYNLDFFQAMEALKQGKVVENDAYKINDKLKFTEYHYINGTIQKKYNTKFKDYPDPFFTYFNAEELTAEWRIVEPEECWLDKYYPVVDVDVDKVNYLHKGSIKYFAHEAIKRIEQANKNGDSSSLVAIGILKEMIGEK